MDKNLETRYRALFVSYDSGGRRIVTKLKEKISSLGNLRPDAALCLITLFDQMIIRPYIGSILDDKGALTLTPQTIRAEFQSNIDQSFDIIIKELKDIHVDKNDPRHSSHDVLIAIDKAWETLSELFGWG